MKFLQLAIIIILFLSCSSKKRVIENETRKITETSKVKDSIIKEVEAIIVIPEDENNKIKTIEPLTEHEKTLVYTEAFNHNAWDFLLKKYVAENGKVNYKGFKNNRKKLLDYISELNNRMPNNDWTKTDKLAYWINAYNAMTIDLILRHYPIKSIKDINKPWEQRFWKLGDKWYNLNEIEHQILRKMKEPRIHFAIVCASISCPKLQNTAFSSANLERQLTEVTEEFLTDSTKNNLSQNNLKLSKIFQWFAKDFKQNGSVIDFINQYSEIEVSAKARKGFKDYNWGLNE